MWWGVTGPWEGAWTLTGHRWGGGEGRGGEGALHPHPGQRESSPTQTDASGYTQQLGTEKKELRTGKDDQVPKSHQGLGSHL